VLGQPLVDTYITDEYKDPVRAVLTAAATGGPQAASYETHLYTKTGERVELLLNATTRRGADGEVMGVLGVGLDMTEVRLVQGDLDKSEKAKLTVWHCMHEGVAIIEGHDVLNGEILECNHAMCELSGVATPDQLRGTSLRQILPQVSGISSEEKIFEICFAGSDSVTRCCEATFKKFQGTPERIALVIRDRTWKKELETQATQLMVRAAHVNTLNNQLKWVQHQVKNSALALEFRLHQVLDVMVQEQVYAV